MNNNIVKKEMVLYMLPSNLKWYQKLLQKLHLKNYYVPVRYTTEVRTYDEKHY